MNTRRRRDESAALQAFGQRLRARRIELKMTMEELARECGAASRQIVERWELGKHYPTTSTLRELGLALKISLDWLIYGKAGGQWDGGEKGS